MIFKHGLGCVTVALALRSTKPHASLGWRQYKMVGLIFDPSNLHPTALGGVNMPSRYPNEPLLREQMSLADLNARCSDLENDDQCFIEHILAGHTRVEEDRPRHVFVNARQGVSAPPEGEYTLWRDYDSAFGLSWDLPFTSALAVFP